MQTWPRKCSSTNEVVLSFIKSLPPELLLGILRALHYKVMMKDFSAPFDVEKFVAIKQLN